MQERFGMRMRPLSAVTIMLVLILPSLAFGPWAIGGEGSNATPMSIGSRAAHDNDLSAFSVVTPHDRDENAGSLVANNAIPVGQTTVQGTVKNVGNLTWAGAIPVDFYFETGLSSVKWNDSMDMGVNGWTTKDLTATRTHWHTTNLNKHGGTFSLVSNYASGPKVGLYGNTWEETAAMKTCVNFPATPTAEPYIQFWNSTNTQSQADGGYVQMQIGGGPWVDIIPWNPLSQQPPTLSYRGNINSGTSILSKNKGAFTGSDQWNPTEKFPLWQQGGQNVSGGGGTCAKFRLWFSADASNPSNLHGWYIDDFVVNNGNGIVFQDNFEGGVGNWVFSNELGMDNQEVFHQVAGSGMNGTKAWWVGNTTQTTYLNGTDAVLDSPSIALTGGGFNEVRFTYWQQYNISDGDGGWLEVSTDGGATYNQIQPLFHLNKTNDASSYPNYIDENCEYGKIGAFSGMANWHKMAFDLTPYMTKTIKIRFHFYANWDSRIGGSWFIDNAVVTVWNFVAKGQVSASLNGLTAGQKAIAQVTYNFATESDYRIRVVVEKVGDQDITNNELHTVVCVKNITDFIIIAPGSAILKTVNHGSTVKFWFNITNIGNLADNYNITISGQPARWNATISPSDITGLRPVDPPFMVQVSIKTNVSDGPASYPDNNKQSKDYGMTIKVKSGRIQTLQKNLGLTARITNTRPTLYFLLQNMQGNVYKPLPMTQPFYSDPDKDVLTFQWDWGDGSPAQNTTTWPVYHTYVKSRPTTNPYIVKLKGTDGLATSDATFSLNVSIVNKAPTAKFVIDSPYPVTNSYAAGDPIVFNATAPKYSQDENSNGLTYMWDFGDGNTGTGTVANHTFDKDKGGNKMVKLAATDEEGQVGLFNQTIMINTPPKVVITGPPEGAVFAIGQEIEFNASQTSDNEQTKLIELDFNWSSNLVGMLGTQPAFRMSFTSKDAIGKHTITLTVSDHRAKGISSKIVSILITQRPWHPCSLVPIPNQPAVTPAAGYISTSVFTFSVIYKSPDNTRPSFVNLIIDSGQPNLMAQTDITEKDYTIGVQYTVKVPGNGIGADQLHTFHYEAADERNTTYVAKTGDFQGPRVTRKLVVQNAAVGNLPQRVVSAEIFCVCKQNPVTFQALNQTPTLPTKNGKNMIPIGLNATITFNIAKDLWDFANLTFSYNLDFYKSQRDKANITSVELYRLDNGNWVLVSAAENDEFGLAVTLNKVTPANVSTSVTYGLFASPKEKIITTGGKNNNNLMQYIIVGVVIAAVIAIVVAIIYMTRRKKAPEKKWGGKDGIDLKIDVLSGKGTEDGSVKPVSEEEGAAGAAAAPMETTTGESVAIYRPAGAKAPAGESDIEATGGETVAVYKPGGAAAPTVDEEEEPAPAAEAPGEDHVWTPPPATEGEGETESPAPETEKPKSSDKKDKDDDLLDEILGDEKK